mgnify:CR=1 FL=1
MKDTQPVENAVTSTTSRKNSIVLDSSSSSDVSISPIVEVTERLKKTCGLQEFRRFSQRSTSTVNSKQTDSSRPSISSTEDLASTPFRSFDSNPPEKDGVTCLTENESPCIESSNRRRSLTTFTSQKSPTNNPTPLISVSSVSENDREKIELLETDEAVCTTTRTPKSAAVTRQLTNKSTGDVLKSTNSVDVESNQVDKSVAPSTAKDSETAQSFEDEAETSKANSSNEVCPWEDE